jgi:hypothetical protein
MIAHRNVSAGQFAHQLGDGALIARNGFLHGEISVSDHCDPAPADPAAGNLPPLRQAAGIPR